jgi:predicted heme/steroid binding protein
MSPPPTLSTVLLVYILRSVVNTIYPSVSEPSKVPREYKEGYSWLPKSHPPTVLFTNYTPQTLARFSGRDGGRILLAIDGIVFDVSAGRNFYGPGTCQSNLCEICMSAEVSYYTAEGMYGNFAGRDASRGMAKQSFDTGTILSFCAAHRVCNSNPWQKCLRLSISRWTSWKTSLLKKCNIISS